MDYFRTYKNVIFTERKKMAKLDVYNLNNEKVSEIELSDAILGYPVNKILIHEVVKMQLANKRQGTHSTKTKGKVSGGGRKPYKQKGTGNARAGSNRSPLWRGGGTTFGPQPRDYSYTMPKKKVKNALKSVIHAKYEEGALIVLDSLYVENGKTKEGIEILKRFSATRGVLFIVDAIDDKVARSFSNLDYADILHIDGLNVYDLVNAYKVIVLQSCIPLLEVATGVVEKESKLASA